jgi:glycosyltransferase involved in cell wall biosynthesis
VAQAVSIHTARWIRQLQGLDWDLHLFDMLGSFPHAELAGITEYSLLWPRRIPVRARPRSYGPGFFLRRGWDPFPLSLVGFVVRRAFQKRTERLAELIRRLQPDIIHSIELQTESYHLLDVARLLGGTLGAPWVVSTWGSDIFYFQQFPEHLNRIQALLAQCNYLIPDCARDEALARDYGFKGRVPLILPGAGGYPLDEMRAMMAAGPTSRRRLVMLKGYEGWAGRALNALEALKRCADSLHDYDIVVYAASPKVVLKVHELHTKTNLRIRILPRSPHAEILELFGKSRLAIGVNATDGVPNAMLEAMAMRAFPIQSDTRSTSEWITDGSNGLLVDPSDPADIAAAIRKALTDDTLMERAADLNSLQMDRRLDSSVVKPKVIQMYRDIAGKVRR